MIDALSLPGPRRFLDTARQQMLAGVCVVVPETPAMPRGLRERLGVLLKREERACHFIEGTADPVGDLHGVLPNPDGLTPTVTGVVAACERFGPCFLPRLSSRAHWPVWRDLLDRFQHCVRQLPSGQRPVVGIFIGEGSSIVLPNPDVGIVVLQRRELLGEADVLAVAEMAMAGVDPAPNLLRRVLVHTLAATVLWDATLAEELASAGPFEVLTPIPFLYRYAGRRMWSKETPTAEDNGTMGYVDGEVRIHSALLAVKGENTRIGQRLWRAQVAVLLPWVEEQRLKLLERARVFMAPSAEDLELMEIGAIWWQLRDSRAPSELKRRANSLRQIRNALAHRRTLGLRELREISSPTFLT